MISEPALLVLTCGSWQEAQRITDSLLQKRLVACVEQVEIRSKSWWQGKIEDSKEIKLVMKSLSGYFAQIEKEVAALHSYETFVLEQITLSNLSAEAAKWLRQEIQPQN